MPIPMVYGKAVTQVLLPLINLALLPHLPMAPATKVPQAEHWWLVAMVGGTMQTN